jgi:hypothetical protein
MKIAGFSLVSAALLSMTVSVASAQTTDNPQVMSGSNPRPQVMSGSNPRPQSTQSTSGTALSAVLAFFGIYTN